MLTNILFNNYYQRQLSKTKRQLPETTTKDENTKN